MRRSMTEKESASLGFGVFDSINSKNSKSKIQMRTTMMEKESASPGFGVGGNEVTFPPSLEGSLPPSNPQITQRQIHKYKICSHRDDIGDG